MTNMLDFAKPMRMGMRRFTRLTNAFSKKAENLSCAISLHFMHYNFARPHRSLANPYTRTPAMEAGVADHVWQLEDRKIVGLKLTHYRISDKVIDKQILGV